MKATVNDAYNTSTQTVYLFSDTPVNLGRTVYEFSATQTDFEMFAGIL